MPRRHKEFIRTAPHLFANGNVNWNSDVGNLKYIGGQYAGILQQLNIDTVGEVVEAAVDAVQQAAQAQPEDVIFDLIGGWTRNARAHSCHGKNKNYLVRPINRFAFNALVDVVDYAQSVGYNQNGYNASTLPNNLASTLICDNNEGLQMNPNWDHQTPFCNRVAGRGSAGTHAGAVGMRKCPCLGQQDCQSNVNCTWLAPHNACVGSQSMLNRGHRARDVGNFVGDWKGGAVPPQANQRRPNARYVPMPAGPQRGGHTFALPLLDDTDSESDSESDPGSPPPPDPQFDNDSGSESEDGPAQPAHSRLMAGMNPANILQQGRRSKQGKRRSARIKKLKK